MYGHPMRSCVWPGNIIVVTTAHRAPRPRNFGSVIMTTTDSPCIPFMPKTRIIRQNFGSKINQAQAACPPRTSPATSALAPPHRNGHSLPRMLPSPSSRSLIPHSHRMRGLSARLQTPFTSPLLHIPQPPPLQRSPLMARPALPPSAHRQRQPSLAASKAPTSTSPAPQRHQLLLAVSISRAVVSQYQIRVSRFRQSPVPSALQVAARAPTPSAKDGSTPT